MCGPRVESVSRCESKKWIRPTVAHHVRVMPMQLALRNRKIFERCVWLEPFTVRESCVAI